MSKLCFPESTHKSFLIQSQLALLFLRLFAPGLTNYQLVFLSKEKTIALVLILPFFHSRSLFSKDLYQQFASFSYSIRGIRFYSISMPQDEKQNSPLNTTITTLLERRRQQFLLRALTTRTESSVDFSSNDFLSLSTSSELRSAFSRELNHGDAPKELASGGSRLLDGNSPYAENLEQEIATFHNAPSSLLCNSGYDGNVGLFSCLPQPGDVIIYDELIHASVHEGMRLSRAGRRLAFAHSCISSFRTVLQNRIKEDLLIEQGSRNVFVAVETVYSMEGDLAPLRQLVDSIDELLPRGNGHLIVDEAHSTGILGPNGRGLVSQLGLESRVFARLHTFGKALACTGGKSTKILLQRTSTFYPNKSLILHSHNPLFPSSPPLPN